jgi:DNA polymerase
MPTPKDALISHFAFWADMGVDTAFEDAPVDRLKPREAKALQTVRPAARAPTSDARAETPTRAAPSRADISAAIEQARALAAAAPDLAALEAAIAGFDGCPLKTQGASRAVFARGRPDAPVMIIGEGPGADEDRQGAPFVGRAGQLLDKMLAAAGLTDQVFITNTVFWRPPANRTPTSDEQAVCAPFVERAIALVRPKLLLLAGGASAKAMLKTSEGILSLRGQWRDWSPDNDEDGASIPLPAMATLHPAFLLRQPLGKKKAWSDLMTLAARLESLAAGD